LAGTLKVQRVRTTRNVAVIGGGWAGIAAAVEATLAGHAVTLFEMAKQCGGRARSVEIDGMVLDNGQHIMIGAYVEVLRLMRLVGVDAHKVLVRTALDLRNASGAGLRLRPGPPLLALTLAVLNHPTWTWTAKLALMREACRWGFWRFTCAASLDVAALTLRLPPQIRRDLIDPLCVAALNTPSEQASARVFLRVLRDALFATAGSSDLLFPAAGLTDVFPTPALRWLQQHGAQICTSTRVQTLEMTGGHWSVQGKHFDHVVLATPPPEAARLAQPHAADWAEVARKLEFEPIMTIYAHSPGARLALPMLALDCDAGRPAQFVFDRGQLGGPRGLLAFVISGAREWVERGTAAATQACMAQAAQALGEWGHGPLRPIHVLTEKRATFQCVPLVERPAMRVATGLHAAGDYVEGPYPATLEGAVRSGVNAVREFC
jgi:hydroxysqualene dehydroxylase